MTSKLKVSHLEPFKMLSLAKIHLFTIFSKFDFLTPPKVVGQNSNLTENTKNDLLGHYS